MSAIIPDNQMPHDKANKPYEVLLNPLGVISRCYDEQTEFLTGRGWVFGRDVRRDDQMVCYHPWSEGLYVLPQLEEFHVAEYRGKMLQFSNKMMDFCVTPNHRMWAACGYPGAPWQAVTAERICGRKGWKVPVAGNPVPGTDADFVLPHVDYHVKDTQTSRDEIVIDAGDWSEFVGWYVAEGNVDDKVHISQSDSDNPENCKHIGELLNRLPFSWHYNKSNTQFHITSKRLCDYIKFLGLGLCADKFVPSWVFEQSPEVRQRFLDGYLAGDGSKDLSQRAKEYSGAGTMSERLASDLQRLLIYQGVSSNVAQHSSGMWRAGIHGKRHRILEKQNWEEVDYDGKIYCPTVPTGYVMTRRNGKILIAGNTNPAQMVEAALGKLARKQGKPISVEDFGEIEDMTQWARKKLADAGLSDLEDVFNPANDRKIKGVATGERFFMKLHHTAESKGQGRGSGGYSADDAPAKGGASGSKRMAMLDVNALLSHGATEVIRDASAVRGQKNEDYWLQFMTGNKPRDPKVPLVYRKFVNELKASGINVVSKGSQTNIMAMTDADVKELAGSREIKSGETVSWKDGLKPIKGGLFDEKLTGGHHGQKWAHIKLQDPMPNPVMEEPIRHMLGLTKKQLRGAIAGTETLPKFGSGAKATQKALSSLNVDQEIAVARAQIHGGTRGDKDKAIRRLGYLKAAKRLKMHPKDWMMTRVPVLPPQFRPINMIAGKEIPLVADPNFLYKDLIEANDNLGDMAKSVGDDEVGEERLAVYDAFKAVTGLGDPITQKSQEKNIRGILKTVFGSSPKFGTVQRKLISSTVDNVGRAVITPNPDLDMDQVGLPEDKAFDVYQRFVARRLKRRGMPLGQALREIKDRSPLAKQSLMEEMEHRPVIINRAPVLHRFGIMAFKPQLTKGDVMQVSPLIVKGFGADFDGDAMNYHVPTTDESRKEALERMLPSRQLLSPADFKSPVHVPSQEYVGGLYHASANKSNRPTRTFAKKEDVLRAWARGDISVNDRIKILET